jgi:hypothetical protein
MATHCNWDPTSDPDPFATRSEASKELACPGIRDQAGKSFSRNIRYSRRIVPVFNKILGLLKLGMADASQKITFIHLSDIRWKRVAVFCRI